MKDPSNSQNRYSEILDYHNVEAGTVAQMEDQFPTQ